MSSQPPTNFPPASNSEPTRVGYVALAGRPNAGKSTLFNAFLGQRLSIVTSKPQTTRGRILGILTRPQSQIIFLDTPGLLDADYKLHETMERQINQAARQADLVLLLVDASRPKDRGVLVRRFLNRVRVPVMAALNKIDLLDENERAIQLNQTARRNDAVAISAVTGEGCPALLAVLDTSLNSARRVVAIAVDVTDGAAIAWLYRHGEVLSRSDDDQLAHMEVSLDAADLARFERRTINES